MERTIEQIGSLDELTDIIESSNTSLILIKMNDCAPCKMQTKILKGLNNANINLYTVYLEDNVSDSEFSKVTTVPTMMIYNSGKLLKQISGFKTLKECEEIIGNTNI